MHAAYEKLHAAGAGMDVVSRMALSSAGSPAAASDFLQDAFQLTKQRLGAFESMQSALGLVHGGKNLTAALEEVGDMKRPPHAGHDPSNWSAITEC